MTQTSSSKPQEPTERGPLGLLADPSFGPYVTGQWLSNTGNWFHNVAIGIVVFAATGSSTLVGIIGGLQYAFTLVLAPLAGQLSDRLDRRRLLLAAQLSGLAGAVGLALLLVVVEEVTAALVWPIAGFTCLIGIGYAVALPSIQAYVPSLVPRVDLPQAIALNSVTFNLARAIGPALAGVLVATAGAATAFSVNALSFGIFAGVLVWLGVRPPVGHAAPGRARTCTDSVDQTDDARTCTDSVDQTDHSSSPARTCTDSVDQTDHSSSPARTCTDSVDQTDQGRTSEDSAWAALGIARRDALVRTVLLATVGLGFATDPVITLAPALAAKLGGGDALVGGIGSAFGIGATASAFASPTLRRRVRPRTQSTIGLGVLALGLALAAAAPAIPPLLVAMGVAGAGFLQAVSTLNTTLQLHVDDAVRGRVMALWGVAFLGVRPLAATLDGAIADLTGVTVAMAAAAGIAAVAAFGLVRTRPRPTVDVDVTASP